MGLTLSYQSYSTRVAMYKRSAMFFFSMQENISLQEIHIIECIICTFKNGHTLRKIKFKKDDLIHYRNCSKCGDNERE